jgi:hypothetical protein
LTVQGVRSRTLDLTPATVEDQLARRTSQLMVLDRASVVPLARRCRLERLAAIALQPNEDPGRQHALYRVSKRLLLAVGPPPAETEWFWSLPPRLPFATGFSEQSA